MRFVLIFSLCFSVFLQAQEIKVLNKSNDLPIANVAIYNAKQDIYTTTDINGLALLNKFPDNEYIYFDHILHFNVKLNKAQIISKNNIVYLEQKIEDLDEIVFAFIFTIFCGISFLLCSNFKLS